MPSFDVETLEPLIRRILTTPGTDLSTISAKRVRKQLLVLDPSLTADFLKEVREEVDRVIIRIYAQEIDDAEGSLSDDQAPPDEELDQLTEPPAKKAKKQKPSSDAVYAKKLSKELNGRSTRNAPSSPRKGGGPRSAKSAATIDSDDDGAVAGTGKKRKRAPKKDANGEVKASTGAKGGFAKEYILSAPLADVLAIEKLSRPQVVKQLWTYIKGNELQNPTNKREIICDEKLRAVFNTEKIDMFKMNKVLGDHLHDETTSA